MRGVAHGMNAAGVDPAVVEIEQRTDGDRIIDGVIAEPDSVQSGDIVRLHGYRVFVHLADEAQHCLFWFRQRGSLDISEDSIDELFAAQKFRRDRGVRLRSKRALVQG